MIWQNIFSLMVKFCNFYSVFSTLQCEYTAFYQKLCENVKFLNTVFLLAKNSQNWVLQLVLTEVVAFQRVQELFSSSELWCARCGFSESKENFSSIVNLDVLDVASQRVQELFSSSKLWCARCGFAESKESFQAVWTWMC